MYGGGGGGMPEWEKRRLCNMLRARGSEEGKSAKGGEEGGGM